MKRILTVADLMTILCDCVDSGTLEMDSEIAIYAEIPKELKDKPLYNRVRDHKVIYRECFEKGCFRDKKYLVLSPEEFK